MSSYSLKACVVIMTVSPIKTRINPSVLIIQCQYIVVFYKYRYVLGICYEWFQAHVFWWLISLYNLDIDFLIVAKSLTRKQLNHPFFMMLSRCIIGVVGKKTSGSCFCIIGSELKVLVPWDSSAFIKETNVFKNGIENGRKFSSIIYLTRDLFI